MNLDCSKRHVVVAADVYYLRSKFAAFLISTIKTLTENDASDLPLLWCHLYLVGQIEVVSKSENSSVLEFVGLRRFGHLRFGGPNDRTCFHKSGW